MSESIPSVVHLADAAASRARQLFFNQPRDGQSKGVLCIVVVKCGYLSFEKIDSIMSTNEPIGKKPVFYIQDPPITSELEDFFCQYAYISASALTEHLIKVREHAWEKFKYPCL
ncbi:unnamed protein product, partial [Rotaria socialis]